MRAVDNAYNCRQLERIEKLLREGRETYRVDLHLHTRHSADGLQTVEQAVQKARELQFDVISITDHDSIAAYDQILRAGFCDDDQGPVIVPGIEFTVSYPQYEDRCHVLKYFFDTDHPGFQDNLAQNRRAYADRVQVWFERIRENNCLQRYFTQYGIACSEKGYWEYLVRSGAGIPEYPTIMAYLYSLLCGKGINVWDVYEQTLADNSADPCQTRREKKEKALDRFYTKYRDQDIAHNYRKLRPVLAPVGVDDADYPDFASTGCLSVGEYGQVPVQKLVNVGVNILAHPNAEKLHCVDQSTDIFQGLELNCRSKARSNEAVNKKARDCSLLVTVGSDKHSNTNESYEDLGFYDMPHSDLSQMLACARRQAAASNPTPR